MFFSFRTIYHVLVLFIVAVISQAADDVSYTDNAAFQRRALDFHNRRRAEHETPGLAWNAEIAGQAESYARRCVWGHSGSGYGENLAGGFVTLEKALTSWSDERRLYKSLADYDKLVPPPGSGHFTQMVWLATTTVGCGRAKCRGLISPGQDSWYFKSLLLELYSEPEGIESTNGDFPACRYVVCAYLARGNYRGQYHLNVRKPARR
ncbi:CAP domain-containing protein [Morchella snyderi]|nr:CAP domain-containing protein [Morchella snyderi]